jgi:crotonobetainyl-CoA:carnitine CoA-transferase CaiB-like acyl-CoA transferase
MGVGSVATRLLADFGAEVIKIEDRTRLDVTRVAPVYKGSPGLSYGEADPDPDPNRGGMFNNYARNKLGVTVNMRLRERRNLANKLIAASDVVAENFAPGVMERWGITYEELRKLNASIIYCRMSGYGRTGPRADYRAWGPNVQAECGLTHISGLPGTEPSGWGLSLMDNQAGYFGSQAMLLAILRSDDRQWMHD